MSDRLLRGQSMTCGDVLRSANDRFYVMLLKDGKLAVYEGGRRLVGTAGWAGGVADPEIAMDEDGILVARDRTDGVAAWRAPQERSGPDAALVLQDDGVLAVHAGGDVVWRPQIQGAECLDPVVGGWDPDPYPITIDAFRDVLPDGDIITTQHARSPNYLSISLILGARLTWWKRITVYGQHGPLGCADVDHDHRGDAFYVPKAELKTARMILWKAKEFGNHRAIYEIRDLTGWADMGIGMTWVQD